MGERESSGRLDGGTGRLALLVLLGAALLQAIYVSQYLASPYATFPIADAALYDRWAKAIVQGNAPAGPFHMAPLYAYTLAAIFAVFGTGPAPVAVLQSLLWLLNGVLVAGLAIRVAGTRAALVTLGFYALYAPFAFYAVREETVTLALTLILATLHLLLRERLVLAGLVAGLATLTRPELVLFLPLAALWLGSLRRASPFLLSALLGILPATLHNVRANGRFVLVSWSGGEVFHQGNASGARGTITRLPGSSGDPLRQAAESREIASRESGRDLAPDEVQAYWLRRALADLAREPGRVLPLLGRKALLIATGRDLPLSYSLDLERARTTPILRLHVVTLPLLLALSLLTIGRPRQRPSLLLFLFALSQVATLLLFFVATRLKVPLVAVVLPFAARGLVALPAMVRLRSTRLLLPVAVSVALLVHDVGLDVPLAESHSNLAAAYAAKGERARAIEEYRLAVQSNPRNAEIWFNLGSLLAESRPIEAVEAFQRALSVRPGHVASLNGLGLVSLRLSDLDGAERLFREAIEKSPSYALARFNLGQVLRRRGKPGEALAEIEAGLAFEPRPEAHLLAGDLARDLGDLETACRHWKAANAPLRTCP